MADYIKQYSVANDTMMQQATQVSILFSQGDINSDLLSLAITNNNVAMDLTGAQLMIVFQKSDQTVVYQDTTNGITITDVINGKFTVLLNSQVTSLAGNTQADVQAQVYITYPVTGRRLVTKVFKFTIETALLTTSTLKSTNYLPILDKLKSLVINDIILTSTGGKSFAVTVDNTMAISTTQVIGIDYFALTQVYLQSLNGTWYSMTVDNTGNLITTVVSTPTGTVNDIIAITPNQTKVKLAVSNVGSLYTTLLKPQKGIATILASTTSIVVTHGLGIAPNFVGTTPQGNVGGTWVPASFITDTQFTIYCGTAPTAATTILWEAEY